MEIIHELTEIQIVWGHLKLFSLIRCALVFSFFLDQGLKVQKRMKKKKKS